MAQDNYIGIAMGLDVTDLKSGLAEANKQIQLANSEFKAASSGMDDWQKSTDGLSAKVKQLDSVLSAQKSKLAGMKAEYDKVAKSQGENSEAARKLKVQINNQQAVVNATQKEFNNYSETLKEAEAGNIDLTETALKNGKALKEQGEAAKESGGKLEGLKGVAGGVAKGLLAVGAAAVGIVGSFLSLAESTRETRTMMAKLETQFTTTGHAAETAKETYSTLYGVLGDTGKASEAAAFLAELGDNEQELTEWTDALTGVYAKFGDSIDSAGLAEASLHTSELGSVQGNLADALEWSGVNVDDFNAQLAECNSVEERQALIVSTLNGLYGEQADKYKETNKDVIEAQEAQEKLNLALAELGKVAEPIMTTLKLLAVDLLDSIKPFVELIGDGLKGALEGTAGAAQTLADGLSGLLTSVVDKIVAMLPSAVETIVSLISTMLPQVISAITGILPQLISTLAQQLPIILQALISGFSQILAEIGKMLPQLIPVVIDAVITIVETLIDNIDLLVDSGIKLLMGLADGLIKAIPRLVEKIPVIIDKLMSAFSRNAPKLIESGIKLVVQLASGLIKAIPDLIKSIPTIIKSIVSGFSDYADDMGAVGLDLVKGIWKGISDAAGWIKEKIEGFAGNVAGWFKKAFKIESPSKLMRDEVGEYIGEGVGVGIVQSMPKVKKNLGTFAKYVQDNLSGIKGNLSIGTAGGTLATAAAGNSTSIDARMTVNYNGNLSRKQLKQLENDNYNSIKTRLKAEGAI